MKKQKIRVLPGDFGIADFPAGLMGWIVNTSKKTVSILDTGSLSVMKAEKNDLRDIRKMNDDRDSYTQFKKDEYIFV